MKESSVFLCKMFLYWKLKKYTEFFFIPFVYVAGLMSFLYVKGKDKAKTSNKGILLFLTEPKKGTQH